LPWHGLLLYPKARYNGEWFGGWAPVQALPQPVAGATAVGAAAGASVGGAVPPF